MIIGLLMILSFYLGRLVEHTFASLGEVLNPVYEIEQINFRNKIAPLYLKSKCWGVTGNHKVTVLSANPNLEFYVDSLSQYIWKGDFEIIYREEKDTLKLYSYQTPEIPEGFQFNVPVNFIKVENHQAWNELEREVSSSYKIFK